VRGLAERAYFALCFVLGRMLRSARYSKASNACHNGDLLVRKHRLFYAPLLVRIGVPLARILDTGVRVLHQHAWEERERRVYRILRRASIRIDGDGTLVLPRLPGQTLATLLEDPQLDQSIRKRAIERAVAALAEFHHQGLTHGDAMAENVLVEAGVAHWLDFETVHDSSRPMAWRRADDVRALLVTCLVRTGPEKLTETLELILDAYEDRSRRSCEAAKADEVTRLVATSFASVWRRPLTFHLAQAGVSFQGFREIGRLLRARLGE
jgi:tRNA A-37 threonylcarbamoyl transferase component Bud32